MDLGFDWAEIPILTAYDIDANAVTSYNKNVRSCAIKMDVCDIPAIGADLDIIIATPPCQGFSTAGGYRFKDPRNNLLVTSCELLAAAKPKVAIIENVAAVTNRRNATLLRRGIETLTAAGYHVEVKTLCCDDLGVPQRRKRAFIVARSNARNFNMSKLSKGTPKVVLKDVLSEVSNETNAHKPQFLKAGSKHFLIAKSIGPGEKLCNVRSSSLAIPTWCIPEVFGRTDKRERELLREVRSLRRRNRKRDFGDADPVSIEELMLQGHLNVECIVQSLLSKKYLRRIGNFVDLTNTFNGKYRRLKLTESSPTVDTRFGDCQLFLHPIEHRGMTVREAARIQGFPDSFVFEETPKTSYRLIGNAVPPPVAYKIAKFIRLLI